MGDESARVIINAIDAVCEYYEHPIPVHIFAFMADDKFRDKVLADTKNPLLQMFKEQYDEKLRDNYASVWILDIKTSAEVYPCHEIQVSSCMKADEECEKIGTHSSGI
jgi:hypothetical protein